MFLGAVDVTKILMYLKIFNFYLETIKITINLMKWNKLEINFNNKGGTLINQVH